METRLSQKYIKKKFWLSLRSAGFFLILGIVALVLSEGRTDWYTFGGAFICLSVFMAYSSRKDKTNNEKYAKYHLLSFEEEQLLIIEEESKTLIPYKFLVNAMYKEKGGSVRKLQIQSKGGITIDLHQYEKPAEIRLFLKRHLPYLKWS